MDLPESLAEDYSNFLIENVVVFVSALVFLPIIAWDFTKFTNRVAGPLMVVERALKDLAAGKKIAPLRLRESDLLSETAEALNQLVGELNTDPSTALEGKDEVMLGS